MRTTLAVMAAAIITATISIPGGVRAEEVPLTADMQLAADFPPAATHEDFGPQPVPPPYDHGLNPAPEEGWPPYHPPRHSGPPPYFRDPGYTERQPDYRGHRFDEQVPYEPEPRYSGPGAGLPPGAPYGTPPCDFARREPYWDGSRWVQPRVRGC